MYRETLCRIEDVERIERVIAALRDSDASRLSLRDMADIACLSPFHFSRLFRRVTGIPPGEFAAAVRLERAKHLLLTTELTVTEVCFEVGYAGLGAFVARFTRLVGVSPGRFRQSDQMSAYVVTLARSPAHSTPDQAAIVGTLDTWDQGVYAAFVGLFPAPIAQGLPRAGLVLMAPRRFCLPAPRPSSGYLVAVGPRIEHVGSTSGEAGPTPAYSSAATGYQAWGDFAPVPAALQLHPACATDPPVVTALSVLFSIGVGGDPERALTKRNIGEAGAAMAW